MPGSRTIAVNGEGHAGRLALRGFIARLGCRALWQGSRNACALSFGGRPGEPDPGPVDSRRGIRPDQVRLGRSRQAAWRANVTTLVEIDAVLVPGSYRGLGR